MIYQLLRNRLYIGEVTHKGSAYPGEHEAIIDREVFDRVGALLVNNAADRQMGTSFDNPSLLAGIIWSSKGQRLVPSHSAKRGKRYHYYAEPSEGLSTGHKAQRMPAGEIDGLVMAQLKARMQHAAQESGNPASSSPSYPSDRALVLAFVNKVIVSPDDVRIQFGAIHDQPAGEATIPAKLYRRGNEMKLVVPPEHDDHVQHQDPALIQFVVRAYMARTALEQSSDMTINDLAKQQGYSRDYYAVLLRIGHLAPDIIAAILNGRQPAALNRQRLARIAALPLDWQGQRAALGFV